MSALGPDIRAALAATRLADAAPRAIRQRGRKRLLSALAAGTVSTTVAIAEGASWVGSGATMTAGTAAGSTLSLAGTLVSSSLIGLSLGLIAITPTSTIPERPSAFVAPVSVTSAPLVRRSEVRARPIDVAVPKDPPAIEASTPNARTAVPGPEPKQPDVLPRHAPPAMSTPPSEVPSPTKASIARELELIAAVRRALINGHAGSALVALNCHAEEFPNGALVEEATASRVVALCALGRVEEGQHWLAEFRSRYPSSPQLKRVQSACPERLQSQNESGSTIP